MDPNISTQPVQPNLPQQTFNESPHPESKFKLILLIVILLLIVGGGAYLLGTKQNNTNQQKVIISPTPTSDQTGDWDQYVSQKLGYSIKYPKILKEILPKETNKTTISLTDMKLSPDEAIDSSEFYIYQPCGEGGGGKDCGVIQKGFYLEIPLVGTVFSDTEKAQWFKNFSQINIDKRTAYKRTYIEKLGGYEQVTIDIWFSVLNSSSYYEIKSVYPSNNKYYSDLFDQILSTFKFTDQNQTTDVSADTFIQNYYNSYFICLTNHFNSATGKSPQQDCPYDANVFTPTIYPQLQNGLVYAKGDPILCAQNIPQSLTFDNANISADGTALVVVHTIWGSNPPGNINVGLQEINNQWKIASISCDK